MSDCNVLSAGYCGLTDGATDWRLPNRFEIESLLDMQYSIPSLSNAAGTGQWSAGNPFNNVATGYYWSSTTINYSTEDAWVVDFFADFVNAGYKGNAYYFV